MLAVLSPFFNSSHAPAQGRPRRCPGETTTYMVVVVMNNGPLNVTGAVFNDNNPARVTSWTGTCTA
ncbi:MAG: hypothetical protein IMZ73_04005 [Chloroflexi bacterium]|jgi:uncharacterized repeat protein (TIGR01451 family)|nr:hypothetical protein [Chloroflexota bacterium]